MDANRRTLFLSRIISENSRLFVVEFNRFREVCRMGVTPAQLKTLTDKARRVRIDILKMLTECGSGHTGGSLSAADIATALYFYKMKYDPKKPDWKGRDHFILSKGHAAPLLYTVL